MGFNIPENLSEIREILKGSVAGTTPLTTTGGGGGGAASSVISTANSSAATLGIGGVFTGTSEACQNYAAIQVYVFADQASATDGLSVQQSSNGTNWDVTDIFTVPASTGKTFSFQPAGSFFRIIYTNGGVAQTAFRLQTVFHYSVTKSSSVRAGDGVSNENDLETVASFGMVWNGTTWDRDKGDYVPRKTEMQGTAASALNADVFAQFDVSIYSSYSLALTTFGSGTVSVQQSPNLTDWYSCTFQADNVNSVVQTASVTVAGAYAGAIQMRYLRVRVTSFSSGSFNGTLFLSTGPWSPRVASVNINNSVLTATQTNATVTAGTLYRNQSLTNAAVAVKASSGRFYASHIVNGKVAGSLNSTPSYVHLYDLAAASVVVGTTVPVWTIAVPASGAYDDERTIPIPFATAIAIAATTSPDGLTSTAPTNNLVVSGQYA